MSGYKITDIKSQLFQWKKPPIWNGAHKYDEGHLHLVTVVASKGRHSITGYGWNGGTAATRPQGLFPGYVDLFRPYLLKKDPTDTQPIASLANNVKIYGRGGWHTQVLGAINQACWDIRGQIEQKSIHELLGGKGGRVLTYIAGGYYGKSKGLDELKREMERNVKEFGATAVKMKIGDPSVGVEKDIMRIKAARETVGDDIALMVDANCAFTVKQALEILPILQKNNVYWFEEPIDSRDIEGHKKVRQKANKYGVLVATGENGYDIYHFRNLLIAKGADVFNIDVAILPGYDPALQIMKEACKHNVRIAPHGAQELHVHIVTARDNGLMLEYYPQAVDPLRGDMFLPRLEIDKDGYVEIPNRPGLGFTPNFKLLKKYSL